MFRAIEKKDLMFLMEVRDRAFHVSWGHGQCEPGLTTRLGIVTEIRRCHAFSALDEDRKVTF